MSKNTVLVCRADLARGVQRRAPIAVKVRSEWYRITYGIPTVDRGSQHSKQDGSACGRRFAVNICVLLAGLCRTASAEEASRPTDHLRRREYVSDTAGLLTTYCKDDCTEEAKCRSDDLTVTWVLIRAALETDDGEREKVAHPGGW